jgi:hypothetical protein
MGGVGPIVGVVTFALMHLEFGAAVGGSGSLWFENCRVRAVRKFGLPVSWHLVGHRRGRVVGC